MPLQDLILEPGPHPYERRHVDLVESRKRCCGVLRLLQAHAIHLRARFILAAQSSGRRRGFKFQFLMVWTGWGLFCPSLWWGSASFSCYGGGEEVTLGFSIAWSLLLRILGGVLVLGSSGSICGP